MATTYTTVDKVGNILGFPNGYFDATSTPTSTVIENFINRAEDRIDSRVTHAWRAKTITKEYIEPSSVYRWGTGIRFDLIHRSIRTFVSGTDKVEIWDGSNWVDWVATKTEGRNNDYWVDYTTGSIYISNQINMYPHGVRVTYRYGETTVPGSIEEATTMMAASLLLVSPEMSAVLFTDDGGSARQNDSDRIRFWKEEIDRILNNNQEIQVF